MRPSGDHATTSTEPASEPTCLGRPAPPSGVAPATQNAAPTKEFSVAISPSTLGVGAGSLTVTVTNIGVGSAASLGSVQIQVPAGLTVTSVGGFSGSKNWTSLWVSGQTVTVGATNGTQKLDAADPDQSVTFTIGVTSSVCGTYTILAPVGSNDTPGSFGPSGWTNAGGNQTVTVNNCVVVLDCPAAPAVANAYLDSIHFTGGRGAIINLVAQHMTQGARFDDISPCDLANYRNAVIAFVQPLLPV